MLYAYEEVLILLSPVLLPPLAAVPRVPGPNTYIQWRAARHTSLARGLLRYLVSFIIAITVLIR